MDRMIEVTAQIITVALAAAALAWILFGGTATSTVFAALLGGSVAGTAAAAARALLGEEGPA